jgi:peptidoglycan-associated lipoprotein
MSSKVVFAVVAVLSVAGCGHEALSKPVDTAHAVRPVTVAAKVVTPPQNDGPRTAQAVTKLLGLDAEIVRLCNLHFDVAPSEEGAPRFDTDETNLTNQDTSVLAQVAQCLTSGALAGRHVQLVGRADSRGATEYNFVLGEHRAGVVSQFLEGKGLPAGHISETSRGELDATGTDDITMRDDRRVDILLGS